MKARFLTRYSYKKKNKDTGELKDNFVIQYFNEDLDKVVLAYVDQNVYNNYNNCKPWTEIPSNKFTKNEYCNTFGQVVSYYKLIN